MISLEDVIAFCDLTPEEVRAIAEHEHVADGIAAVRAAACFRARMELNRSKTC